MIDRATMGSKPRPEVARPVLACFASCPNTTDPETVAAREITLEVDSPKELAKYALVFLCIGGLCSLLAAMHAAVIGPCADLVGAVITVLLFLCVPIGTILFSTTGIRWLWQRHASDFDRQL
jgi:hypothetical protein